MADDGRMPQMTTRIDPTLREEAVRIAELRDERDLVGKGLSVVVRKAVADYVKRHRHLIDEAHSPTS